MKAARIHEYGGPEAVKVEEIEQPAMRDGGVLVKVFAASINPFDSKVRQGVMKEFVPLDLPVTLGGDLAGEVIEVSAGVERLNVGDKVYGQANAASGNSGAFAEVAATSAGQIANMPSNVDYEKAAALPLTGVSALQALEEHMKLQAGQKILIHGGAGGIGTVAIQLAKHIGAYVATTATGEGIEYVRDLGADEVIDYQADVFEDVVNDYDAVFDTVGGDVYRRSYDVLRPGGVIVSMLEQPNASLQAQYDVRVISQQTKVTSSKLARLAELVEQEVVTPHVDETFTLEDIREAFAAKENGTVKGKVVVKISE